MAKTIEKNRSRNAAIRREVIKVFQEVVADPDFGLELRPEFLRKLRKSIKSGKSRDLREYLRE